MINPQTYEEALDLFFAHLRATVIERHREYGSGNLLRYMEADILRRIGDKEARAEQQIKNQSGEKLDDTITDIAGYASQWWLKRRGWLVLPMEGEE